LPTQVQGSVQTTPPKGGVYLNQNISPISKEVLLKEINKRKLTIVDRGEDGKFYSPKGGEYVVSTSVGIVNFFLKGGDTVKFVTPAKKAKGASWQSKTSETISFASCNLQSSHKGEEKTQSK
jgi:hypothetical protein